MKLVKYKKEYYLLFKNDLEKKIPLLEVKKRFLMKAGYLNHLFPPDNYGLIYKNHFIFHSLDMNFDIFVACFDKYYNLISTPFLVPKNRIFIVPLKTKYVCELSCKSISIIKNDNLNKKIILLKNKFLCSIIRCIKLFFLIIILANIVFISFSCLASEQLNLLLGKDKTLDLGQAPLSIQISDPDIIDVNRVGMTNSIKLIPKQNGFTTLILQYSDGNEQHWNINVGKAQNSSNYEAPNYEENFSNLDIIAKPLRKINGISYLIRNGKVIIVGSIKTIPDFRKLVKIVSSKSTLFYPAYEINPYLEEQIYKILEGYLKLMGEKNLQILNRAGFLVVSGVSTNPAAKNKVWSFLSALLPNLNDHISLKTGDSSIVQINLEFLEVGKLKNNQVGTAWPGMHQPIVGNFNLGGNLLTEGFSNSTLQVAPLSILLKALKERNFARNIAKPVILTRSGEKAFFLAGGEVPIVSNIMQNNQQSSSVSFKPFGILFHVTPILQNDGAIWVQLDLEVSDVSDALSYQNIPGFVTRKLKTNIILKDENYVVLSGLIQTKHSKSISKLPLIGDLPIIGELFKSRKFKDDESELWIAISATKEEQSYSKMNEIYMNKLKNNSKNSLSFSLLD
ncbi:pilus assembly protein N-terminal domain-containing protein [Pigmentibacter sp. JX0631]|uniref:pilus assembly protein N-terminal domain-containing protein n=1 Tax=Pigmentibacter sp. JX0631 TaxID=2976982 RepID=UPI00246835A1|nr:pilus assembly protein N-terminal domain-containing protein [Pigmentibacter sp. JX0631]WGL60195.1 pilus assembly protein N-terminal domain-containing protein [Pigmentibacter sp. JX0631]